jgi:hypothetical protein
MADTATQAVQAEPDAFSGQLIPFRFVVTWQSLSPHRGSAPAIQTETQQQAFQAVIAECNPTPVPPEVSPSFALVAKRGFPIGVVLVLGVALVLGALRFSVMRGKTNSPGASVEMTGSMMDVGGTGWMSEWVSDPAGSALGRQISLYRPSSTLSNYRLEFAGRILRQSLGFVFRAVNARNYSVVKLEARRLGDPLVLTRFAVIKGVDDPHIHVRLPVISAGRLLKIRLDAVGSRFTVFLQDQVIDDWQDDRLASGAVGFVNEREELGQVESVQVSFLKGGIRQ